MRMKRAKKMTVPYDQYAFSCFIFVTFFFGAQILVPNEKDTAKKVRFKKE